MNLLNPLKNGKIYVTIVSQSKNVDFLIDDVRDNLRVIYDDSLGIGKSRNLGKKYLHDESDIIMFTDDDVIYEDLFFEKLQALFENDKKLEVAFFNVTSLNLERTIKEIVKERYITRFNIFRYGMFNTAIKKDVLEKNVLDFSTKFGGNSKYLSGEDSIFIYELFKRKCRMKAFPILIAKVTHENSTWYSNNLTEKYYISKGALFYAMDKRMYKLYLIYYSLKHFKESRFSFFKVYSLLKEGAKKYKREDE